MKSGKIEKLAYALGGFGSQFCWGFISSYITIYLTDNVAIAAALVGTMLMLSRFLDGITDIIMGYLVDHTNSKWGKARPWVLYTAVPLGIMTYLCFNVPAGLPYPGKVIYIAITYTLTSAGLYTANNVAYQSLASFMTNDKNDRVVVGVVNYIFYMLGALALGFTPNFQQMISGSSSEWHGISIVYSVICASTLVLTGLVVRERNVNQVQSEAKESFFTSFKVLVTNKYFLMIFGIFMAVNMKSTAGAAGIFYTTYVLKDVNYNGLLTVMMVAPFIAGMFFAAPIVKKFGFRKSSLAGFMIASLGYLFMAVFSESIVGLCVGMAVTAVGYIPAAGAQAAITAAVADHVYWKTGIPAQGTTFSCSSATSKLGAGIASALVGILLTVGHYIPNGVIQPGSAIMAIKALYIYIPGAFSLCSFIIMYFFDIEKYLPAITQDISDGKVGKRRSALTLDK